MSQAEDGIRIFDVVEPRRHKNGFTIYKIISRVVPKNSFQEITEVTVWKRFNDLKKLHKSLVKLHHSLHLKGAVPSFPDAKLFGRFEADVIEQRRQAAQELFQFAAQHPPLLTNAVFVQFFAGGVIRNIPRTSHDISSSSSTLNLPPPIEPQFYDSLSTASTSSISDADLVSVNSTPSHLVSINGQSPSAFKEDIFLFDPLASKENGKSNYLYEEENENWFIYAIQSCDDNPQIEVRRPSQETPQQFTLPKPFASLERDRPSFQINPSGDSLDKFENDDNFKEEVAECQNGQLSIEQSNDLMKTEVKTILSEDFILDDNFKQEVVENLSDSVEESNSNAQQAVGNIDYLVDAATLISQAQEHEVKREFEAAFESYKCAVGILIEGVGQEVDSEKRASVRKKAFQYLTRAEQIYDNFLSEDNKALCSNRRWAPDSPFKTLTHSLMSSWFGSVEELEKFKVIGVINRVQVVENIITHNTFVIKVIYKSAGNQTSLSSPSVNIFPQDIPNMVQLYRIFKTEYALFLLLEFARGGRLFDHISSAVRSPASPCPDCTFVFSTNDENLNLRNIYSGRRLSKSKSEISYEKFNREENQEENYDQFDAEDEYTKSECIPKLGSLSGSISSIDSIENDASSRSYLSLCTKYELTKSRLETSSLAVCRFDHLSDSLESIESISEWDNLKNKRPQKSLQAKKKQSSTENINLGISNLLAKARVIIKNVDETLKKTKLSKSEHSINSRVLTESKSEINLLSEKARRISEVFHQMDVNANLMANSPAVPEEKAKIWLSQIIVCLKHLHKLGIIYCDLKPDNLLLTENENLVLTYKCFWNEMNKERIDEEAKEKLFVAPELSLTSGKVSQLCDWWSFGVIAYQLLTARSLFSYYPNGLTDHTALYVPDFVSLEAKDLLCKLLQPNPQERLGRHGHEEITMHPFFSNIDWSNS